MKVVCDACQAKYQIPDERVAGRRLKIRCRKCGATILVRPEHDTARNSMSPAASDNGAEWHVSLQGDQHGPYPTDQMGDMLRGGQLAWDAYVWRESYGDWKMAGDSDTLVKAVARASSVPSVPVEQPISGSQIASAPASHPGFDPGEETPTRMMQSSPGLNDALRPSKRNSFAARAQTAQSQPQMVAVGGDVAHARASQPHMVAVSGGAQARATSQPGHTTASISGSYAPVSSPTPISRARVSMESSLTGERNEDSVLFSARNLVAATSNPSPSPTPSRPGYAQAEGSGLIDIRALAALTRNNPSTPAATQPNGEPVRGRNTQEEIFRLANQTGAFGKLDSIAPIDRPSQTPNSAVPLAIFGGSALIALAGVFAVYMLRPQAPTQPVAVSATSEMVSPTTATPSGAVPAIAAQAEAVARQEAPKADPETERDDGTAAQEPAARGKGAVAVGKIAKGLPKHAAIAVNAEPKPAPATKGKASKADPDAVAAAPEPRAAKSSPSIDDLLLSDKPEPKPSKEEAAPAPAPVAKGKRSIDDLLDDAVVKEGNGKKSAASEAAGSALPDTPSRDQVMAAMNGVKADVAACAEGQTLEAPTAMVAINVAGSSGKVTSARVTGITGTVGSCIARVVRGASFPKFAREQFSINFPFKLKP